MRHARQHHSGSSKVNVIGMRNWGPRSTARTSQLVSAAHNIRRMPPKVSPDKLQQCNLKLNALSGYLLASRTWRHGKAKEKMWAWSLFKKMFFRKMACGKTLESKMNWLWAKILIGHFLIRVRLASTFEGCPNQNSNDKNIEINQLFWYLPPKKQ